MVTISKVGEESYKIDKTAPEVENIAIDFVKDTRVQRNLDHLNISLIRSQRLELHLMMIPVELQGLNIIQ